MGCVSDHKADKMDTTDANEVAAEADQAAASVIEASKEAHNDATNYIANSASNGPTTEDMTPAATGSNGEAGSAANSATTGASKPAPVGFLGRLLAAENMSVGDAFSLLGAALNRFWQAKEQAEIQAEMQAKETEVLCCAIVDMKDDSKMKKSD